MPFEGNDGSARSLNQAMKWFDKCRHTHQNCGPADLSFCPSRLLELRSLEGEASKGLQVKLVETKHISPGMEYACLSHCWGGITPVCVTNKASIQNNLNGIPWSNIPQTFQDAMILTWKLRLTYIWIDSLCIIQEDDEDWRREAATMASVYSNSSITISATSSADCLQGLYQTDPARVQVHELKLSLPGQRSARVLVHPILRGVDWMGHCQTYLPWYIGRKMPLLQRAWFFQEWHLFPRLLHFADGEIVWQCRCGSLSQFEALEGQPFPGPAPKIENTPSTEKDPPHKIIDREFWFNAVEAYSSLQLTFREKDVLAAISGVAKQTEHFKRGDTYAAGIWLENLHEGLCWISEWPTSNGSPLQVDRDPRPTWPSRPAKTKEWAAPSWSWASVNGSVSYQCIKFRGKIAPPDASFWYKKCNINEVTCILAGDDTTGPLQEASMRVSGLSARCTLEYNDGKSSRLPYNIIVGQIGVMRSHGTFWSDYDLEQHGKHRLAPGSSLKCSHLLGRSRRDSDGRDDVRASWTNYLILTKSRRNKDAYERVGLLHMTHSWIAKEIEAQSIWAEFVIV